MQMFWQTHETFAMLKKRKLFASKLSLWINPRRLGVGPFAAGAV
jgi:hypothetical protein